MGSIDPVFLIGLALLGCGLASRWASRRSETPSRPVRDMWIDGAIVLVLTGIGMAMVSGMLSHLNPRWLPVGQDWREFVVFALDIQTGGDLHPVPQRYPFYPWLAVQLSELQGLPLYLGLMQLSVVAAGLIPAALYLLGIQMAPRPVAVAGAVLSLHIPTVVAVLGPPTDYLLHALAYVLCLAAGTSALLRGGWGRYLAWGTTLALLMAITMKTLAVLLVAVPVALVGLGLSARREWRRSLFAGVAWLLPMVIVWQVYAGLQRWVQDAYTLDYNIYRTQVVVAQTTGRTTTFPSDLGWHESDEKRRGYWGVGRDTAFTHLPETLRFLVRGPTHNLPAAFRFQSATRGLAQGLHISHPAWLGLGVLGLLAVGSRRRGHDVSRRTPRLDRLLAIGWVGGVTGAHFLGLMSTHYIPRYALVLLVPLPLLLLAGGAWLFGRSREMRWWPLVAVVAAVMTWANKPPGFSALGPTGTPEAGELALNPHVDFWNWRDALTPEDVVVDLTGNRILSDLVAPAGVRVIAVRDEDTALSLKAQSQGRRYLVEPGCLNMGDLVRQWQPTDGRKDRFERIRRALLEDTSPGQPLSVSRDP